MVEHRGVVAVVLNFNGHRATLDCVESLNAQRDLASVIVVDNGSPKPDLEALTDGLALWPHVALIAAEDNLGFGGGMNVGIAAALDRGADSVLLLNNDTLLARDAVHRLRAELLTDPLIGIVGPLITTGKGVIWAAGGEVSSATLKATHRQAGQPAAVAGPARDVTFAPGAAMLVSARALRASGGFAESFFLYCEDLEFSIRVRGAGFRIRFIPTATVWHAVQGGDLRRTASSMYYRGRNSVWLGRQRIPGPRLPLYVALVLARLARAAVRRSERKRVVLLRCVRELLRGVIAGFGPMPDASPRMFPR